MVSITFYVSTEEEVLIFMRINEDAYEFFVYYYYAYVFHHLLCVIECSVPHEQDRFYSDTSHTTCREHLL